MGARGWWRGRACRSGGHSSNSLAARGPGCGARCDWFGGDAGPRAGACLAAGRYASLATPLRPRTVSQAPAGTHGTLPGQPGHSAPPSCRAPRAQQPCLPRGQVSTILYEMKVRLFCSSIHRLFYVIII